MADGIAGYLPGLNNVAYDSAGRVYKQRYDANGKSDLYAKRELTLQQKMLAEAQASPENYVGSIGELGGFLPTGQPSPPTVAIQPSRLAPVATPAPQPATIPLINWGERYTYAPTANIEPTSIGASTPTSTVKPAAPITQAEWLASGQIPALTQDAAAILRQVRAANPNASEKDMQMQVKKAMADDAEKQFLYKSILDINRKPPTRDELYATVSQQVRAANPDASERDIQIQVNKAMALAPSIANEPTATAAPTGNAVLDELNKQKAEYDRYSWPEMLRKGQAAGVPMENIIAKYNELQKVRPPALTAEQEKIRYEAMGTPSGKPEPAQTVAIGDKIMQWNPKTGKYDVEVGAAPVKGKPVAEASLLPPDALKIEAEKYRQTGELPKLGSRGASTNIAIIAEAAKQAAVSGQTAEALNLNKAAYKAASTSLTSLEKNRANIISFANTTNSNLDLVLELSKKVDRTGVPVINRWYLAGNRSIAGDVETAKYEAAVRTAINEYAKVTTSATAGGVTSDAARKEIEDKLNTAQTPDQVTGVVALLKQEVENRKLGYQTEIDVIKQSISNLATPSPTASASTSGAIMAEMPDAVQYSGRTIVDDATGKRLKSDGKTWVEAR